MARWQAVTRNGTRGEESVGTQTGQTTRAGERETRQTARCTSGTDRGCVAALLRGRTCADLSARCSLSSGGTSRPSAMAGSCIAFDAGQPDSAKPINQSPTSCSTTHALHTRAMSTLRLASSAQPDRSITHGFVWGSPQQDPGSWFFSTVVKW